MCYDREGCISKALVTDSRMILEEKVRHKISKENQADGFKAQVYFSVCENNQRKLKYMSVGLDAQLMVTYGLVFSV